MTRTAILGCGYVGTALTSRLTDGGHNVIGVRRSGGDAIEAAGGRPILGDLTRPATLERLPDVDAVVFAASSGGGDASAARDIYVDGLATAIEHFGGRSDPPDRFLYTSSTGVYGDHGGDWVDEQTPIDHQSGKTRVLAEAEQVARSAVDRGMTPIVARIAGIYGPDRWGLERYLDRPVTEGYRNHIHRDDVAGAIAHVLAVQSPPELVLLVDDEPVHRWTFADWLADQLDRTPPEKRMVEEALDGNVSERAARRIRTSKRCDNALLRSLDYAFRYPTYREGYPGVVQS